MWEIFGSLFGVTYLAKRISSERSALKEIRANGDNWEKAFDAWSVSVTNRGLEEEIELCIYENFTKMKYEAETICPYLVKSKTGEPTSKDILRVLMANHGKITCIDSRFGIQTPLFPCGGEIPKLITRQHYLDYYRFVGWLRWQLNNCGVEDDMFFKPSYGDINYYTFEEAENHLQNGTFYWKPQDIMLY